MCRLNLPCDLSSVVVQIDVGETKTSFDVLLELLCTYSPYFDDLFFKRFEEAIAEPCIFFPDDDPQVFAQIILQMYRGESSLEALGCKKMEFLVWLWIMAVKLEMADLENLVMAICKQKADQKPTAILARDTVNHIYSHTLPQSPMRGLAVDIWARSATTKSFEEKKGGVSQPFLEDLCTELITQRESMGLPTNWTSFPEDRHLTLASPLTDKDGHALPPQEAAEVRHTATEGQMKSRKTKTPHSRRTAKSRISASAAPIPGEFQEQHNMDEDFTQLNIQNQ
ncbi:uncharacterized protein N7496_004135 [Penicillium cataractarum]|uniref:BTB domain-containing protein n=1 Tax=Penicillium cataractarum TaxID=2100454 RepID=A0A9W9SNU4_9EURO|nr:uncharacterized protein N7496_004135 [Penicillium cataractarum]KAJ5381707.1 hypothetical protein N7496_004135 [Penicillium cataractarum]